MSEAGGLPFWCHAYVLPLGRATLRSMCSWVGHIRGPLGAGLTALLNRTCIDSACMRQATSVVPFLHIVLAACVCFMHILRSVVFCSLLTWFAFGGPRWWNPNVRVVTSSPPGLSSLLLFRGFLGLALANVLTPVVLEKVNMWSPQACGTGGKHPTCKQPAPVVSGVGCAWKTRHMNRAAHKPCGTGGRLGKVSYLLCFAFPGDCRMLPSMLMFTQAPLWWGVVPK